MNKLLFTTLITVTIIAFSGCSTKSVKTPDVSNCVGCEDLPDCVPGPYGDCLPKNKN